MFGIFRKVRPYDYGYSMVDEAIRYTQPVYNGLMNFVNNWDLKGYDQYKILNDPYYQHFILIYSGVAVFEFSAYQMRSHNVNEQELRRGFHAGMEDLAANLSREAGENYSLELEFISEELKKCLEQNSIFQATSLVFDENDFDNCLLAALVKKIAVYAIGASEFERELTANKFKNEMLEAFEGLERGFRWIIKTTNPSKIKSA